MKFIFVLLILLLPLNIIAEIRPDDKNAIERIIKTVKTGEKVKIAKLFRYPIKMFFPNPNILNENEFIERFDEVLDSKLINDIVKSTVSDNWAKVGWRGIMFDNGNIWISFDGKINKVNYTTDIQNQKIQKIISGQKESIHPSIREFKTPTLEWDIGRFHIRIDQMNDLSYRYASWSKTKDTSQQPDIVLKNGSVKYVGSGGNHSYNFNNENFLYRISRNYVMTEDMSPGQLEVFEKEKLVLSIDLSQ